MVILLEFIKYIYLWKLSLTAILVLLLSHVLFPLLVSFISTAYWILISNVDCEGTLISSWSCKLKYVCETGGSRIVLILSKLNIPILIFAIALFWVEPLWNIDSLTYCILQEDIAIQSKAKKNSFQILTIYSNAEASP